MVLHLRQKIAQMLCFGFNGSDWSSCHELREWLSASEGLGWLIEFDFDCRKQVYQRNIFSLNQVKELNQAIKHFYSQYHPEQLPILLSIDVEGGKVDRLARLEGYEPLPSAQAFSKMPTPIRQAIWQNNAQQLKELGFDLNFSPVVDLNLSPEHGIFGPLGRCFSDSAASVIDLTQEYLTVFSSHGVKSCLKHFPGHGSAVGDSHQGFVDVTNTFSEDELIPYQVLLQKPSRVQCIMTAHVINRKLDDSGLPATLSQKILKSLLREQLQYQGLIISDDLQMYAIAQNYSQEDALVYSIEAGADVLMFCNQLGFTTPNNIIDCIVNLVEQGRIQEKSIDAAYQRIECFKKSF